MNYPDEPGYENLSTSYDAAQKVSVTRLRALVVSIHKGANGLTDAELDAHRPIGCPTLRPRRCELTRKGIIVDTGTKRLSPTNRQMIVWGLAECVQ